MQSEVPAQMPAQWRTDDRELGFVAASVASRLTNPPGEDILLGRYWNYSGEYIAHEMTRGDRGRESPWKSIDMGFAHIKRLVL